MGSAIAALFGLALGLTFHGPWENHARAPQIWFSSAAAEALSSPPAEDAGWPVPESPSDPQAVQLAELDTGYIEPNPLPLTRLAPDRFDPKPAVADEVERVSMDDGLTADAEPAPTVREVDQPAPTSP